MAGPPSPTLSDSELLEGLDEEFDFGVERERRMAALREQALKAKELEASEYGRVVTYGEEKKLIERMSKEKWCVIHFFHPDFPRCRIMDKKLDELAPKYPHTLFLRASVADIPFLVGKLGIQVLPCVYVFVDGRGTDRLIGFEDLGHDDNFSTAALEFRLKATGVLHSGPITLAAMIGETKAAGSDEESDDDAHGDDKARRARRGKVGIRNGIANLRDAGEDEYA